MLFKLLECEQIKLKRTWIFGVSILIPFAINLLLTIDLQYRYTGYLLVYQEEMKLSCWQLIFKEQRILYFTALIPFFATLILIHVFSIETKNNGWSMVLTQPIKKSKFLLAKYIVSCKYITVLIFFDIITIAIAGIITGIKDPLDVALFIRCFLILWSSAMATAAIQMSILQIFPSKWIGLFIAFFLGVKSQDTYLNCIIGEFNPYSFTDYSFRANWNQTLSILIISYIFIIVGLLISTLIFNRKKCL
ncbi:ABC transporter permease [Clostridium botulinum]|uniref:ABC transporter permease n=1 Tax=Clostridium botulinum TaxID=1491 RepID=UPI0001F84EDA|nr:ABC transporter permease [Clostridium botulinum]NFB15824.1 ABC transporter permease [Clostridium botulinum]NFB66248.1 ABC transporter permease [Clostridium botulinum]NFB97046.1 ABC transporter permease [Clostridium botulinum]NFC45788.1 ABC transporter permease [Clostridium botulinum]NFC57631.1 ABC transporter permease [Clostridium botulinum]